MITLDDCRSLCDADPALVAKVAREESLPDVLALARAHQLACSANHAHPYFHARGAEYDAARLAA